MPRPRSMPGSSPTTVSGRIPLWAWTRPRRGSTPIGARPADASALDVSRAGSDWITRKVAANGIISVAWQEINLGKQRAGRHVNVHLDGPRLQVFDGDELLRTVLRTTDKEVRKKRYERRKTG